MAVASGAVGARHVSGFHRFFGRATWSLDAVGRVVFTLAQAWVPADQPLLVLVDDTLARQGGKGISLAQCLGFEDPRTQAEWAVARTAPLAGIVYALVLLWSAEQARQGRAPRWIARPWYRAKAAPSFLDLLTAARQAPWHRDLSAPPCSPRCPYNASPPTSDTGGVAA